MSCSWNSSSNSCPPVLDTHLRKSSSGNHSVIERARRASRPRNTGGFSRGPDLAHLAVETTVDNLISRRQFCAGACAAASGALFAGCSGSSTSPSGGGSATPLGKVTGRFAGSSVQVTVSGSPLATVGGAALVQSDAGVFLVSRSTDSAFAAVEAVCTHEGCTVDGTDGSVYV